MQGIGLCQRRKPQRVGFLPLCFQNLLSCRLGFEEHVLSLWFALTCFADVSPQGHDRPRATTRTFEMAAAHEKLLTLASFSSISLDFFILACQNGMLTGNWQEVE